MRIAFLLSILLAGATTLAASQNPPAKPPSLASLKAAAEAGSAQAQLDYAKALKSRDEGRVWAQKAADQGLAEAWFWLGYNASGGLAFYEKAAEKGYAPAFGYLLDGLLFRAGAEADIVKAKRFGDIARSLKLDLGSSEAKMLETIDRCFEAGAPAIPADDRPSKKEAAASAGEDCVSLREGPDAQRDLVKYRQCVLSEDPLDNNRVAELYANGWGVKRNPTLAIALVCHASEVPAELMGMVETLHSTRNDPTLAEEFLFCSHVTSGMNQGECAMESEGRADAARAAALDALAAAWPATHQEKFIALRKAADEFFTERSGSEVDLSGTGRVAWALQEEGELRDAFLSAIRDFESGKRPPASSFAKADAELNAIYGRIMKRAELDAGTVTKDGIRETQRAWLRYRDAWVAFGAAHYPGVAADAWKAWATAIRVAQLKELVPQ